MLFFTIPVEKLNLLLSVIIDHFLAYLFFANKETTPQKNSLAKNRHKNDVLESKCETKTRTNNVTKQKKKKISPKNKKIQQTLTYSLDHKHKENVEVKQRNTDLKKKNF